MRQVFLAGAAAGVLFVVVNRAFHFAAAAAGEREAGD